MKIQSYKELEVWQIAMDLADYIYDITAHFPIEERFGLSQQMRRSVVSIASNIAEGSARNGTKELIQFIYIAKGSLAELETQLFIAKRRKYLSDEVIFQKTLNHMNSVGKMLTRLVQSLLTASPSTIHQSPFTKAKKA